MVSNRKQPDVRLTIRRPTEPDGEADRRLRAALKALGRRYGLRCVEVSEINIDRPACDARPAPCQGTKP